MHNLYGQKEYEPVVTELKTIGKMEGIEILGVENVNQAMNLV